MKRLISLIIVISIITSICCMFAQAEEATAKQVELNNMLSLLKLTGIMDEKEEFSDGYVTRAEFAKYLVYAKGMKENVSGFSGNPFSDVTSETLYANEIMFARKLKLINGYSDGSFKPESNISVFEAAICMLRALGYDVYAEALGGFPGGYNEVLRQTKLLDGVESLNSDSLTRRDAVVLIYNALHTKVLGQTAFGDEISFGTQKGNTLLYDAFKIYVAEGIVNGIDITNLYGENDLSPYRVYIGDERYYTVKFPMNDLLGYYVRAYIKYEEDNDMVQIAYPIPEKNHEEIIKISDIIEISENRITVDKKDGTVRRVSFNKDASIIYNGTNTSYKFDMNIFINKNGEKLNGTVKLLDTTGDNKSDVVFVDAYEEMIVGKINSYTSTVYDYYDFEKNEFLSLETNEPYVIIYNENNEEIPLNSLKQGTSLMIYNSLDDSHQEYIRVYASFKTASGKIESTDEDDYGKYITVDNKVYRLSEYALKNSPSVISGRTVVLSLNYNNEVVKLTYSTNPGDYSFAMIAAVWKEKAFEGGYTLRLVDTSGNMSDIPVRNKVKVDGNFLNLSSSSDVNTFLSILRKGSSAAGFERGDTYLYQIIKFGIDAEGKINYIDTAMDSNGNKMLNSTIKSDNELYTERIVDGEYLSTLSMLGEKVILSPSSVVFMVPLPGEETDMEKYGVETKSYFVSEKKYTVSYYKDSTNGFQADYLMCEFKKSKMSFDFKASYIIKVTDAVNEENLPCKKLYCYQRGATSVVLVDKNLESIGVEGFRADNLKAGDIIYYEKSSDGMVGQFILMYKYDTNTTYTEELIAETRNKMYIAHTVSSTPYGIKLIYENAMNGLTVLNDSLAFEGDYTVFNNTLYNITVINRNTKQPKEGSYLDVIGYDESKTEYSKVLIHSANQARDMSGRQLIREIFVYK